MNTLDFVRGQTVVAKVGKETKAWLFFRVTHRDGFWVTLKPLLPVEEGGKWIPGDPDPKKKTIRRLVSNTYGRETMGGLVVDGFAAGLRVYRKPRGGRRVGAGRKPGRGKGRTAITRSISMQKADWDDFDEQRKGVSRGNFLSKLLQRSE
jgi:hypothetical protein